MVIEGGEEGEEERDGKRGGSEQGVKKEEYYGGVEKRGVGKLEEKCIV